MQINNPKNDLKKSLLSALLLISCISLPLHNDGLAQQTPHNEDFRQNWEAFKAAPSDRASALVAYIFDRGRRLSEDETRRIKHHYRKIQDAHVKLRLLTLFGLSVPTESLVDFLVDSLQRDLRAENCLYGHLPAKIAGMLLGLRDSGYFSTETRAKIDHAVDDWRQELRSRIRDYASRRSGSPRSVREKLESVTAIVRETYYWSPLDADRAPSAGLAWTIVDMEMHFVWVETLDGWVGKCEVTNHQYRYFAADHSSGEYRDMYGRLHSLDERDQPAVQVTFSEAVAYAKWLTEREKAAARLPEGMEYRLPDGDEWMTFSRCGDGRKYPWGDGWPPACGNYRDKTFVEEVGWSSELLPYDDGHGVACSVYMSGRNEWGVLGVGGNVWEWTSELKDGYRVSRGNCWLVDARECMKCSTEGLSDPSVPTFVNGFRLVLVPREEVDR